jgi:PilZ domain-containing protein
VELRRAVRYPIKAPAMFTWQGSVDRLQGEGVTRDISGLGAYVRTPTCPPPGITLQMEILLPPIEPTGKSVRVATEGRVIRVEGPAAGEAHGGFAMLSGGFAIVSIRNM